MIFSAPRAHAEEFCALGSFPAGEEISAYIAMVGSEAVAEAEGLPTGLWLSETPGDMGKHLSLEGRSMVAGELNFSISVSEEPGRINCSVGFEPSVPVVSIPGDMSCAMNDSIELHVSASVADSGTLSYQWYSGEGLAAVPIPGATSFSYRPDTSLPGRFAYFCQVTNYNNSYSAVADSDIIYLSVAEPRIIGIELEGTPAKLLYAPGDKLDTTGLKLRVNYDNGSSTVIDSGFEASPTSFEAPGKQLVNLAYEGFRCYYEVEISMSALQIDGIGVLTMPQKTQYELGDSIDPRGLVIRAYTPNGHVDIDSGFDISPAKLNKEGRQTVTVTYQNKSCSFTVDVKDGNTIKSISIASLPTRREYAVGDTVDMSGLSLRLIYGSRSELVTQGFDWSPKQFTYAGAQEVTISYGEHTVKFSITVKDKAATPSPTPSATAKPSPSAAPESISPSPSSTPTLNDRDHEAKDVNALVKVIFAVAIVSLIALAGYVLWMQKRGKR